MMRIVTGAFGEKYIQRKINDKREYFAGYDEMGGAIWEDFDVDFWMDEESAKSTLKDLEAAEA